RRVSAKPPSRKPRIARSTANANGPTLRWNEGNPECLAQKRKGAKERLAPLRLCARFYGFRMSCCLVRMAELARASVDDQGVDGGNEGLARGSEVGAAERAEP